MRERAGRRTALLGLLLSLTLAAGCSWIAGAGSGPTGRSATVLQQTRTITPQDAPSSPVPQSIRTPPSASSSSATPPPVPLRNSIPEIKAQVCPHPAKDWNHVTSAPPYAVQGFTSVDSALPGTQVGLYISAKTPRYRIQAYRMGYYGTSVAACLVWTSAWQPGKRQAAPKITGATHTPSAPWSRSMTLSTKGWQPGHYLLRIDGGGPELRSFMPLTVRSPSFAGRVAIIMPDTTWQAYNSWGGYSLYKGPDQKSKDRARAVTFDRPYSWGQGAADFVPHELPLIVLAEKLGLSLGYATDVDLQRDANAFLGARAIISAGHDEYYSPDMRGTLTAARDRGVNLGFFGANDMFRKIRFGSTKLGQHRLMINYKDATDPIGIPSLVTTQWRDPPSNDPESALTGADYRCATKKYPALIVADAGNWLFAGTGVRNGTALPKIGGQEFDGITVGRPIPRPLSVLFHSPADCYGAAATQDSTYYTTASGAGVLDVGAYFWNCALANSCPVKVDAKATAVVTTMTPNFLLAAALGPLGRTYPATDNVATFYPKAPPFR